MFQVSYFFPNIVKIFHYTLCTFFLTVFVVSSLCDFCVGRVAVSQVDDFQLTLNQLSEILHDNATVIAKGDTILRDYEETRQAVIAEEEQLRSGGELELTIKEQKVNKKFMQAKLKELNDGFKNPERHAPSMHFFHGKPLIEQSKVFKFVKDMPKGGVLHVHNKAAVSAEWVIQNLTYIPGVLKCVNKKGVTIFAYRDNPKHNCLTKYVEVQNDRSRVSDYQRFDKVLETKINLYTKFPEVEYNTINKVWTKFQNMFDSIGDLLKYEPAYRAFHWRMLEEMYEDNVMYAEIRMKFGELFDGNNRVISEYESINILIDVVNEFKELYPDFLGIKIIYSIGRNANVMDVRNTFETFKILHKTYPDFIVGFDLVGQEDKGKALHNFVEVLQDLPKTAKFFFHAGETNWYGSTTDLNLLDAILMNTTRIGHGYALLKHPLLSQAVKDRGIALEVSPISNQVLDLVLDLRNHPAGYFISDNIPMVISNDDPCFWNAKGLSYDFYYAIMSFAPVNAGLKTLKNLAWSSIKYSALNENEKELAYDNLQTLWDEFLDRVLNGAVI